MVRATHVFKLRQGTSVTLLVARAGCRSAALHDRPMNDWRVTILGRGRGGRG